MLWIEMDGDANDNDLIWKLKLRRGKQDFKKGSLALQLIRIKNYHEI
jgi:hypothetical protein